MIALLRRGIEEEVTTADVAEMLGRHTSHAGDDVEQLAAVLVDFLHSVPDALVRAMAMAKDEQCGRAVSFATGTVLNYVFDEEDLLPEASFGTVGLLDDAYLVHGFVALLGETYPFIEPATDYSPPDEHAFEIVSALLPEGVAHSLLRTCRSTIQVAQALFPSGAAWADETGNAVRPTIRVSEALRATAVGARSS
jgi:hypothetical protein